MANAKKQPTRISAYRRGGKQHYAELALRSIQSRIQRHIKAEIVLDPERVTKLPARSRETDAGYDVYSPERVLLPVKGVYRLRTGLRIKCPTGYFFRVEGRSSLNENVRVLPDIIDAGYTGELVIRLVNLAGVEQQFRVGDRLAQIVFLPQIHVQFCQKSEFASADGERGTAGFGSSGA